MTQVREAVALWVAFRVGWRAQLCNEFLTGRAEALEIESVQLLGELHNARLVDMGEEGDERLVNI